MDEVLHTFTSYQFQRVTGEDAFTLASPTFTTCCHNNVEIVEIGRPVDTTEESWDRVNDVSLKSMFLTCEQVLPHMERRGKA